MKGKCQFSMQSSPRNFNIFQNYKLVFEFRKFTEDFFHVLIMYWPLKQWKCLLKFNGFLN